MVNGVVVGVVLDNRDPDGLHRVKVKYPVEGWVESTWCRVMTPMGGADRGLVILPDIGTEVLLGFAYRSLSPYVLGAVYNGADDTPAPYRNDDGSDSKRVFWSRSDHLLVFDDTPGAEQVGLGACAPTRLDVRSAPVHHVLDAAGKELTERCDGTTVYEAKGTVTMACTRFSLRADTVLLRAGSDVVCVSSEVSLSSGGTLTAASPNTQVAGG
jgi:uncharacterized protein involved in type VI secretion and phage assembly